MFWFAAAAVVMSAAQAKKQANTANQANSQQYLDSLKQTNAQNKAIMEANVANTVRTAYRVNIAQLETARNKKALAQQGYNITEEGMKGLSENVANAAASGTVGSSVDAAADNIIKKQDDATLALDQTFDDMMLNAELNVDQIIQNGIDSLLSPVQQQISAPRLTDSNMAGFLAGASTAANYYASGKLNLGSLQKRPVNGSSASLFGSSSYGAFD